MSRKSGKNTKNLNHLLNFHYEDSDASPSRSFSAGSSQSQFRRKRRSQTHSYKGKHRDSGSNWVGTKDDYLNSICIFGLRPDTKTTGLIGNTKVEWIDIETVTVENRNEIGSRNKEGEAASCPICLDKFCAPRMTGCGHIFCWLCLLRLFKYSSDKWGTCPLCFAFVQLQEAKRVNIKDAASYPKRGEKVDFLLAQRYSSCIVYQFLPPDENKDVSPPNYCVTLPSYSVCANGSDNDNREKVVSRLYLETPQHVLEMIERERINIDIAMTEAANYGDTVGISFLHDMMKELDSERFLVMRRQIGSPERVASLHEPKSEPIKYLYCLPNCRNVFLHPFNVRCLLEQFGDMSCFPRIISGMKILDIESCIATPETLKRYTFLSHIPYMTPFYLVEVDFMSSDYINCETKEKFKEEFKKRQEKRQHKKRAEKRKERRYANKTTLQSEWEKQLSQLGFTPMSSNSTLDEDILEFLAPLEAQQDTPWVNGHNSPPEIGSFSAIVNNNGFFPTLPSSSFPELPSSKSTNTPEHSKVKSVLGSPNAIQTDSNQSTNSEKSDGWVTLKAAPKQQQEKPKRKGGKKVSLFSNAPQRTYRS